MIKPVSNNSIHSLIARLTRGLPYINYVATQRHYFELTEDQLYRYFSKYGFVDDVLIIRDPKTYLKRNFGFVFFADLQIPEQIHNDVYAQRGRNDKERIHKIYTHSIIVRPASFPYKMDYDKYLHYGFNGFLSGRLASEYIDNRGDDGMGNF